MKVFPATRSCVRSSFVWLIIILGCAQRDGVPDRSALVSLLDSSLAEVASGLNRETDYYASADLAILRERIKTTLVDVGWKLDSQGSQRSDAVGLQFSKGDGEFWLNVHIFGRKDLSPMAVFLATAKGTRSSAVSVVALKNGESKNHQ